MCSSLFSQQTKAHTLLAQYFDLLDIIPSNLSFAQILFAYATFGTSLAFQMWEEMSLEKIYFHILDFRHPLKTRYAK